MSKPILLVGCCVVMLAGAGCQNLARPNWFNPGPASYQRAEALRYDPYTETDIGPKVDGGRPPNFQQPIAEPARARWTLGQ